jgi:TonB family protein
VKIIIASIAVVVIAAGAYGQRMPEPQLYAAGLPVYPPIARAARIQGDVKIEFVLNQSGEPISVTALSGPGMLRSAAEANVKTWRFHLPQDLFRTEWRYQTTFRFKFSDGDAYDNLDSNGNPKLTVVLDSYRWVEVITKPPSDKYAQGCPVQEEVHVPKTIREGDYVELSRSGCYGTCPAYTVRVSEGGDVTWTGEAFVSSKTNQHAHINAEAAHVLLQSFLTKEFWSLCDSYSASITDSATTGISVAIDGQKKAVSNYANSAPEWLNGLENAIDLSADTHQWRHGDPRAEPLSNISQDSYFPKPGVTPLMRAAANDDVAAMKLLIKPGVNVDATDSSGWTALMYAATNSNSEPVELLLKAGANPNYKSLGGHTPLMASAISGTFDITLQQAGANINAQDSAGITALMILAAKGDADEVKTALDAGADATLKDADGRTALDYLHLANCGKSPIPKYHAFETGGKCDHLDEDDVKKIAAFLKNRRAAKTR